jgi:hypothetical protein
VLTKCRGWLVTTSCRTYHHISLPSRIAVGDTITISFGSHPKEFRLWVARIDLKGEHCAIFSKAAGDRHRHGQDQLCPVLPGTRGALTAPPSDYPTIFSAPRFDLAALMPVSSAEVFWILLGSGHSSRMPAGRLA